jgi:hypothetical protein
MDRATAKATLRDIARFKRMGLSKHCRDRMTERNVSMEDIVHVLLWGTITNIETVDPDRWRCTITGEDLDGDELVLVAALDAAKEAACVTVY